MANVDSHGRYVQIQIFYHQSVDRERYNGIIMSHQQINGTLATIGPTTNGFSLREGVNLQGQDQEERQKVHPRQREKDLEKPQKNHQVLDHLPCHHMPPRAPHG